VSPPLWLSHPASAGHDTGPGHPERVARMTAIEQELGRRDWLGWERREAPPASLVQLAAVHAPEHVAEVRAMSEAGGGAFDPETPVSPGSWAAALHAAGGACALAEALLAADAPTGFSAARPPGHHARPATAMGFCLLNNVAVAAQHALDGLGAGRVMVIDWDVHHGNGTNEIFRRSDRVLYASIHQSGIFPGTGPLLDVGVGAGEGFSINLPVPAGADEDAWLSLLEWIVLPAGAEFRPDLVLISAGFDAHRDDPLAGCELETGSFREMARHVRALGDAVGAPVGAVLEGGYDLAALAGSVVATMEGLTDGEEPRSVSPDFATSRAASQIGHFWAL
jgi:acetoin utilization deacetylase AcuC-like enzyme